MGAAAQPKEPARGNRRVGNASVWSAPINSLEKTMAHFYGTLRGKGKNAVTKCGTKNSGLTITAQGCKGQIEVKIYYDKLCDEDMYSVSLAPANFGPGKTTLLAVGVLNMAYVPIYSGYTEGEKDG